MRLSNVVLILAALLWTNLSAAQSDPVAEPLTIGVKIAPPFVMKGDDGRYFGISIELWEAIADQQELDFNYRETDLNGLISGLENGELDASVAALTVTAARESVIDFSHPFHTTGLAIAVPEQGNAVLTTIKRLFSIEFLASLAALAGLLMLVGLLLWFAERKKNSAMFGGSSAQGIGSSFWWAAVTMTTVGYGDKAPVTFWGRMIALIWMFAAIIIISSFTAAIATSLTVGHFESSVSGVKDLKRVSVATVAGSVSDDFLRERGISFHAAPLDEAVAGLASKQYDAVVYDEPILKYVTNSESPKKTRILPKTFLRQDYAIALPEASPLRDQLNQALLEVIASDGWKAVLNKYVGDD